MMVPALLFIEKPYYNNLLATGTSSVTSPFRRMSASVSLINMVMVLKKCCVLWVNWQLIFHDDCGDSKADSGPVCNAPNAAADAASDGRLSLTDADAASWYNDPLLVPKMAIMCTCVHLLIFVYSIVAVSMGDACSSSDDVYGYNSDVSDSDDSDDDEPRDDTEQRLCDAVQDGKLAEVNSLLDGGASPNASQSKQWDYKRDAYQHMDYRHFESMLREAPIVYAARNGHWSIVEALRQRGAEAQIPKEITTRALLEAARNASTANVGHLLDECGGSVSPAARDAVEIAEASGRVEVAALLQGISVAELSQKVRDNGLAI
eukprot:COSAG04_NODE_1856_length_5378_cov_21.065729_2_plen_318_part_01